jgi:hypothetical protein
MGHDDERRLDRGDRASESWPHAREPDSQCAKRGLRSPCSDRELQRGAACAPSSSPRNTVRGLQSPGVRRRYLAMASTKLRPDRTMSVGGERFRYGASARGRIRGSDQRRLPSWATTFVWANEDALLDVEDEKADGDGLAETANLEPDEGISVPAGRSGRPHACVAGPESGRISRTSRSPLRASGSLALSTQALGARASVDYAGQDWRSIEVAVKQRLRSDTLSTTKSRTRRAARDSARVQPPGTESTRGSIYRGRRTRCLLRPRRDRHRCFGCGRFRLSISSGGRTHHEQTDSPRARSRGADSGIDRCCRQTGEHQTGLVAHNDTDKAR